LVLALVVFCVCFGAARATPSIVGNGKLGSCINDFMSSLLDIVSWVAMWEPITLLLRELLMWERLPVSPNNGHVHTHAHSLRYMAPNQTTMADIPSTRSDKGRCDGIFWTITAIAIAIAVRFQSWITNTQEPIIELFIRDQPPASLSLSPQSCVRLTRVWVMSL
jgi:hypothetical protein